MKAIEKEELHRQLVKAYNDRDKAIITAFLDGILADPEAMERVITAAYDSQLGVGPDFIEALKQEAEK